MDTLKTAIVVVLLLAVLYGVYVTLNQPDQEFSDDVAWEQQQTTEPLQVAFDDSGAVPAVTASLGDSVAVSPDPAGADMHDHNMAGATDPADPTMPEIGYGQPPKPVARAMGVTAPELIASASGGPSGSPDNSIDAAGIPAAGIPDAGTYPLPPAPLTDQTADSSNGPTGYDAGNSFPSKSGEANAGLSQPPTNPSDSVYAPPYSSPPSGTYGDSTELTGNAQSVATAEPPVADSYAGPAASPGAVAPSEVSRVSNVVASARGQIDRGEYYEALLTLSLAYNAPGISPEESQQLQGWLDPLAGKVIYSKEHLIGQPYQIQAGESLSSVASKHNVPWQLLANINGLREPEAVGPGTSIKVVPGPFHAEVDVQNSALTLFAGKLYAGRFAITVNQNNMPPVGEYRVNDKQPGHSFNAGNAQTLGPQDPQNPYGGVWIDLGNNVSIHATSSTSGQSERLGCISLDAKDANDLYGILSIGSNVVIRR